MGVGSRSAKKRQESRSRFAKFQRRVRTFYCSRPVQAVSISAIMAVRRALRAADSDSRWAGAGVNRQRADGRWRGGESCSVHRV